jgi:hypothetical protein
MNVSQSNVVRNWVYLSSKPCDEYSFVPWLNKNVYRRTVDLSRIYSSEREDERERKGLA